MITSFHAADALRRLDTKGDGRVRLHDYLEALGLTHDANRAANLADAARWYVHGSVVIKRKR